MIVIVTETNNTITIDWNIFYLLKASLNYKKKTRIIIMLETCHFVLLVFRTQRVSINCYTNTLMALQYFHN